MLRDALAKAERAQREREQMGSERAIERERLALDELAMLVNEPVQQRFLWHRVQEAMQRYGYDVTSTLLELAQNADDALAEAAEINGRSLPPSARKLVIDVLPQGDAATVDVVHYGRPINETGGSAFPAGRDRQWDQDLYFMMLMNLSGKPGEVLGQSGTYSTTGRFGLGFKSVHLLSERPSVVSGFISFSIAGGLLPEEEPLPSEGDVPAVDGRSGTRIRLPLREDKDSRALLQRAFKRFNYARMLLPVFAREICEVIVRGGPTAGRHGFNDKPVSGAQGWSLGAATNLPGDAGAWRVLRFKPAEAGAATFGTLALAVGIRDGQPTIFPDEIPFLWNVVPTSESWGCGYALNGPFKLDPGRSHVSLDDETTLRAATGLGDTLGISLVDLHDAGAPPDATDGFFSALWRVLANGMNATDPKRQRFLRELHGDGRGLSGWIRARSVVPTGLPTPFPTTLPQLTPDIRVKVASDDLDDRWCEALAEVAGLDEDMATLVRSFDVVSGEVAVLLRPLLRDMGSDSSDIADLTPRQVVAELAQVWDYRLTPDRLCSLRPIGRRCLLRYGDRVWAHEVVARSATGEYRPLRQLLLPKDVEDLVDGVDEDVADELLRSAFAPDCWKLDSAYIENAVDLKVFRWLRERHGADATTMVKWIGNLETAEQSAALQYLIDGSMRHQVLDRIRLARRPDWLAHYDSVVALLEGSDTESWRRASLLIALFPDHFRAEPAGEDRPSSDDRATAAFFNRLADWWADDRERADVIGQHERDCWPSWLREGGLADRLRSDSPDHWLALFILGACQSLGRTKDVQHRDFLELARERDWWEVFLHPDDDHAWMGVLRRWHESAIEHLEYKLWLSLFPTVYQFSRHLDSYRTSFTSADRRPAGVYSAERLRAPRSDPALSGSGTHFDVPPLPLGGIGLHWVLRELVRCRVLSASHLFRDCYVPAGRVLGLLGPLGLSIEDSSDAADKSKAIYDFLEENGRLDPMNPHFTFRSTYRFATFRDTKNEGSSGLASGRRAYDHMLLRRGMG